MYEGRPFHDKEKDSTGTIERKKANKYSMTSPLSFD